MTASPSKVSADPEEAFQPHITREVREESAGLPNLYSFWGFRCNSVQILDTLCEPEAVKGGDGLQYG